MCQFEYMDIKLKQKLKSLALLNAIIEPEWEYRYYSYNSTWGENEEMASLRDSCGGEWFIWFSDDLIGFKCTSPVDGLASDFSKLTNQLPTSYSPFINESAFSMDSGSAIWYLESDIWKKYGINIADLPTPESVIKMSAKEFCVFAEEMYEVELDEQIVGKILEGKFEFEMASALNSDVDISELKKELMEIGLST